MRLLLLSILLAPAAQDPTAPEEPSEEVQWLVDVAPDGSRLAVALHGDRVELWEPVDLQPLTPLEPPMQGSRDVAFAPCGRRLAALDEEGKLSVCRAR